MFGRRCSLCNGKLDSRNICKECGLDNTKSEKYYKINQSNCDNLPLTHVHEETRPKNKYKKNETIKKRVTKAASQQKYSNQQKSSENKAKKSTISVLITLLLLVIGAIPTILGIFENETHTSAEPEYYEESYDPYAYLEQEHPEEGDTLSYTLTSGNFIVGVHIAPGNYYAEVMDVSDYVEVTDHDNSIYLYEYIEKEERDYLDDLRLFEGAVVTITSREGIVLHTDNGQTGAMSSPAENFLTETFKMYSYNEAEAGVDFEPGIYDLSTDADYSYVNLTIYDENGAEWDFRTFDLGEHGVHGTFFRNVVIPEGAIISCEDAGVELTPSEWIWTTDYMEHYY